MSDVDDAEIELATDWAMDFMRFIKAQHEGLYKEAIQNRIRGKLLEQRPQPAEAGKEPLE